ncbi:MAG: NUDIX hydrolase, partial [Limnochordales bacterium]
AAARRHKGDTPPMLFALETKRVRIRGQEREFTLLPHPGAVVILAERDGRFALVRQLRPAVDEHLWELPAGTRQPGEDPTVTAQRELAEETGLRAATWELLGVFYPAPGYSTEIMYLYWARDLTAGEPHPDDGEDIETVAWFSPAELAAMVRDGRLRDGKTIAALYYWHLHHQTAPG